jgi:molybdopterin molybdotransferase
MIRGSYTEKGKNMVQNDGMGNADSVDFETALRLIDDRVNELGGETRELGETDGYLLLDDVLARVDMPAVDMSEKDGFAIRAEDVQSASASRPVTLEVSGQSVAGGADSETVRPGGTVRINTGAALPTGADTVIPREMCAAIHEDRVQISRPIIKGQDVLRRGTESHAGQVMEKKGARLSPDTIGILVAAGIKSVQVQRRPRVALIAIGDELALPGTPIDETQRYASNVMLIAAWLARFDVDCSVELVRDDADKIEEAVALACHERDLVTTVGGTGYSDRDFVVPVLERLGWEKAFRGVQMVPGKGALFGMLQGVPLLGLPGGAPSSEMGFFQLMLPLVSRLAGDPTIGLPRAEVKLGQDFERNNARFDAFFKGALQDVDGEPIARTVGLDVGSDAPKTKIIIRIPAGVEYLEANATVQVQMI